MANLSRLGRDLAVELAAVTSAATPDGTADSESSAQPAAQRVVVDPSSRSPSSKVTAVPSDSRLELPVVSEVIPSVAPEASQASMCDEQLVSIRDEIALSGITPPQEKKNNNKTFRSHIGSSRCRILWWLEESVTLKQAHTKFSVSV